MQEKEGSLPAQTPSPLTMRPGPLISIVWHLEDLGSVHVDFLRLLQTQRETPNPRLSH